MAWHLVIRVRTSARFDQKSFKHCFTLCYLGGFKGSVSNEQNRIVHWDCSLCFEKIWTKARIIEREWRPLVCLQWRLVIAELWRAKRACGSPWVSKSTHPRKFGNQVTAHLPPARPSVLTTGQPMFNLTLSGHFLASLGAEEDWYCTHIAHQCCDQLTAVKTGYPLTSITWPYHGLRCRPIEVEYFWSYPLTSY